MEPTLDFEFGFNDANFSDRFLRIVILPDHKLTYGCKSDEHGDCIKPICEDQLQSSNGDEASQHNEMSSSSEVHCSKFQEKVLHVSSIVLAAHSAFLRKLFSNGMKESGQQHATLHIQASEEPSFMDLLKFMYSGKLVRATPSALRDVLMAADKFDVPSCIKLCGQLLNNLEMTLELALLYLDFDSVGLLVDFVRPRLDTVKEFIGDHFKDITRAELQEELFKLPLVGIKAVLSSDRLQVNSEDEIYNFMLKWVRTNYSDQLEQRTIIDMLVNRFLRSPFLSTQKWETILASSDIDPAVCSELALGALRYFKSEQLPQQAPNKVKRRAYKNLHLQVVLLDRSSSHSHSVVYLDLKRDECENYFSQNNGVRSRMFFVGEHQLCLCLGHAMDSSKTSRLFGLFLAEKMEASKTSLRIACDIASMDKLSEKFVVRQEVNCTIAKGRRIDCRTPILRHSWPWTTFISKDSPYFINDVLLLRYDITIKNV